MRVEIFEAIVIAIEGLVDENNAPLFAKVYKNTVPVWTEIMEHPAIAIAYAEESRARSAMCTNRFDNDATIMIYIYNKSEEYEDVLSGLIEEVIYVVEVDEGVKAVTLDCVVSNILRDMGSLHPHYMVELTTNVRFLERVRSPII